MNYKDYKLKKGDKVNFTFYYGKGFREQGVKEFEGTFDKYLIVDDNGFVFKFGSRNIKKANHVLAVIYHKNEYGVNIRFNIDDMDSIKLINQASTTT
jgi:hypothetical protein